MPDPASPDPAIDAVSHDAIWLDVLAGAFDDRRQGRTADPAVHARRYPSEAEWLAARLTRLADAAATGGARCVGPYRLLREIGRGGQAVVYEAHDPQLRRSIALKVLRPGPTLLPSALARFAREAALAARLEDPGLCTIHATGHDDDHLWIAMRLLPGGTLRQRLSARAAGAAAPDPASTRAAVAIVHTLLRTLHRLHEAGVVHRDLKPGNVAFDEQGHPVVLDLGLAAADDDDVRATRSSESIGTPAYMAPEQLAGKRVDRRADVYALGLIAYETIALRHPFTGRDGDAPPAREQLYRAILDTEPALLQRACPAAGVDRDLDAVLATAIAKEPERRYATAAAFADDLGRWLEGRPVVARRQTLCGRLLRWQKREPALANALAAALLVLAAGLCATTFLLVQLRDEQATTAQALRQARATALRAEAARLQASQPATALRLALAAHDTLPCEASRSTLYAAWTRYPVHTTLPPDGDTLTRAVLSSDRSRCLLGAADGSARVWNLHDPTATELPRGDGPVTAAALAEDGRTAAIAHGRSLTVWRDGERLGDAQCERTVYDAAFTPTGDIVCGDDGGAIVVRDERARPLRELPAIASPVAIVRAARDGTIAAIGVDGSVQIASADGEVIAAWRAHDGAVPQLELTADGSTLLAPSPTSNALRVFDCARRGSRDVMAPLPFVRFTCAGGGRAVVLAAGGHVHVLDLATGKAGTIAGTGIVAIAADATGAIATAAADGELAVMLPDGRRRRACVVDGPVRWLELTADGGLGMATEDGAGAVWALHTAAELQPDGPRGVHTLACFDPDGTLLGGVRGGVAAVQPGTGATRLLPAARNAVAGVACTADGRHVLALLADGGVQVLDRDGEVRCRVAAASKRDACELLGCDRFVSLDERCARVFTLDGAPVATIAIEDRRTTALACSPDGSRFAVGSEVGEVVVHDRAGERLHALSLPSYVDVISIGPRNVIAAAERSGFVLLADDRGATLASFRALQGKIESLHFTGTGDRVLVAGGDGAARVFGLDGGMRLELRPGDGPLMGARFVGNGERIVAVSRRGAVHLWSAAGGEPIASIPPPSRAPLDWALAPGGEWLVLDGLADSFVVLPLDERTLLARARECAGSFSAAETARFADLLSPVTDEARR